MGTVCFKVDQEMIKPIQEKTFFDLKANDIKGRRIDFYTYKNRRAFLLVNVASKSIGARKNFKILNEIYSQHSENGLEILAFPCGQFSGGEPKDNEQIREVLEEKIEIKFSLFEKVDVNGENTHPVYKYVRNQSRMINPQTGKSKAIPENFTAIILDKDGKVISYHHLQRDIQKIKEEIKGILAREKKLVTTKQLIPSARTIKSIRAIN